MDRAIISGFFRKLAGKFLWLQSGIAQKILIVSMALSLAFLGSQYLMAAEFLVRPDVVSYNKAVDLYQNPQEKWPQLKIVDYYQKALLLAKDSMIKGKIAYNIGTMLLKGEIFLSGGVQTDQAISYLQEALRQNPDDIDAAYNLELALLKKAQGEAAPQDPDYGYPGYMPGKGDRGDEF